MPFHQPPASPGFSKQPERPALPQGYLSGGYFEDADKQRVKTAYILEYPQTIARTMRVKNAQLRKYYGFVLRLRSFAKQHGGFESIRTELARLVPFSQYGLSRRTVSPLFCEFIDRNLAAINDTADFDAFVKHFEAIVAYLPKDS